MEAYFQMRNTVLDHSVTSSMLNCFTTPFYCRGKQQTHSQRKVQPVITVAFQKDVGFLTIL